ncbi:6243_t:CDS:2 [Acaulospora colombiana]|uniref:6243_t:CDS:1 n=1 Tax=Acaulospora colombiana TaxID=27376 RepID=A0ACA9KF48_9GLOM|nr:6243_t:CDS:2 [Acaulospora colombiana]
MSFDFLSNFNKLLEECPDNTGKVPSSNKSADLDSVIGSIAYAHLNNQLANFDRTCLPIIQIPRSDIRIRPECVYVFEDCGFSVDTLIFIDDITPHIDKLFANYDIQLVLVDHNELIGVWKNFSQNVEVILDHHEDKGLHMNARLRCVENVGSATSLVVLNFKDRWERESDDAKLAKFFLAPILADTIFLDVSKGRTTNKDQMAADFLLNFLELSENVNVFIKNYYDKIRKARFDIFDLSNFDLLRKDYKERNIEKYRVGISSIGWNVDAWIKREGLEVLIRGLKEYCQTRELDLLIVMLSFDHGGFRREMIICSVNGPFCRKEVLEEFKAKMMGLERHPVMDNDIDEMDVGFYVQKNPNLSRKQVYPIVENSFLGRRQ